MDARCETRGAPRLRIPAVGADRKPGRDLAPVSEPRPDRLGGKIVSRNPRRDALDAGICATLAASASAIRSFSIFQPKASSPISAAWNSTGRGGKNAPVSSMRRNERRGAACGLQISPQTKGFQKSDRLVEQSDGASPSGPLGGAAADNVESGLGHAERGSQPRKPRARDQDVRVAPRPAHRRWSSSVSRARLAAADGSTLRSGRRRRATLIRRKL